MTSNEVTELIILKKVAKKLTWPQLAVAIGMSKEWTTAALLGQRTLTKEQANTVEELQVVPYPDGVLTPGRFSHRPTI